MPRAVLKEVVRDRAQRHVEMLAQNHRIKLQCADRDIWSYEADYNTRTATIPPIRSVLDYMIALHEIGHLTSKAAKRYIDKREDSEAEVLNEGAAWAWAAAAADPTIARWITAAQEVELFSLFGSYLVDSMDKPHRVGRLNWLIDRVPGERLRNTRRRLERRRLATLRREHQP